MIVRPRPTLKLTVVALTVLALGCEGDPAGPELSMLSTRLVITGNAPDPDGATVRVDGGAWSPLFSGEFLELGRVVPGSHVAELGGLSEHCQVAGENPRMFTVSDGSPVTVSFEATCNAPADDGSAMAAWLRTVGPYPEGDARADTTSFPPVLEEQGDQLWSCTVERVSAEQYPDDYATFNPNAEVIFPGSMLQGATLVDATPEPVLVRRAGGTLVINLVNGSTGVFRHVEEVKQSTVIQAINDILAENSGIGTARFTYNSSHVQSHEELAASLRVNVSTLSADFRSSLAFSHDRHYNRFLVRLNQSFYTVSFDLPLALTDLFHPSVTVADLEAYAGAGNPPTYISSVTYGRTFFLLIESTATVDEMRASIQASYSAAVVDGSLDAEATYVKDLANVNIKVFALGGDQSLAAANFNGDLNALGDFLTHGADIRTGTPLSYVVRNVADNRIANVKVATDYDVKSCVPVITERLESGFADHREGWTSYGNGTDTIQWRPGTGCLGNADGNGCILQTDRAATGMVFRAPLAWRDGRSWLAFHDGTLSYDLRHVGEAPADRAIIGVAIEGPAGRLTAVVPRELLVLANAGWETVTYRLHEDGTPFENVGGIQVKWLRNDGAEATREDMRAVLHHVTDLRITGDFSYGDETTYLDRVRVLAPDSGGEGSGM